MVVLQNGQTKAGRVSGVGCRIESRSGRVSGVGLDYRL